MRPSIIPNALFPKGDYFPALAIFDLDGTIIRGDSYREMVHYIYPNRGQLQSTIVSFAGICRRLHLISLKRYKEISLLHFRGWSRDEIEQWGVLFYRTRIARLIAQQARAVIRKHKAENRILVLATGSPDVYVHAVADALELDHVLCTRLQYERGYFTGRIMGEDCLAEAKRNRVISYANMLRAELKQSYFYTDQHSDLSLLNLVGNPYAVNPTPELQRFSESRNWPILDWRID
jgi:putative phosphoserine phosphatase/1-acylglycerol-3-phosphate O-acyltransferase